MHSQIMDALRENPERFHALGKSYDARRAEFEEAVRLGRLSLAEIQKSHAGDALLRICHFEGRVKSLYSVARKAMAKDVPAGRALDALGDVVGLRVVVANSRDVARLIEELRLSPTFTVLDQEEHAEPGGYRAVHLDVACRWSDDAGDHDVRGELQIRTLMQDAWAILSHRDFYKNTGALPALAQPISEHLSNLLASADGLADRLRQEMESRVTGPSDLSDEDALNADGIAFLYYQAFSEKPQQYEVDFLLKKARELGVATIGSARAGLIEEVLKTLAAMHRKKFWTKLSGSEAFEYGLLFAAKGVRAFKEYQRRVETDWAEVEALARREALSEMPDTYKELKEELKRGNVPWVALSELGAVKKCLRCNDRYLDADAGVEAISEYYGEDDIWDELYPLLADVDAPESVDHAGFCSYCGWQLGKND